MLTGVGYGYEDINLKKKGGKTYRSNHKPRVSIVGGTWSEKKDET